MHLIRFLSLISCISSIYLFLIYSSIAVTNCSGLTMMSDLLNSLRWLLRFFLVSLIKKSRWKESKRRTLNPLKSLFIIYVPVKVMKTIWFIISSIESLLNNYFAWFFLSYLTSDDLISSKDAKCLFNFSSQLYFSAQ